MAPPPVEEYDLIFAGGGTAGCLVASRLADADPNLKILVVEAGPHIQDDLAHLQPARFLSHLHPESKVANFVVSNPEPHLGGIQKIVPTGHCVGGGSSINFMMYTRASASDYDDWENVYGNKGWSSKDLIPFLKKVETYEVSPDKHETHGYSGPLKVSYGGWYSNIAKDYLEAGPKYEKRGVFDDGNGLFECNKYARWPKWISQKDGMRSDVSHNFIYNKTRKNLTLVAGHLVKRVLFEYKRAVGIEFVENPRVYPNANGEVKTARARRLVVVSGGSLGSPAILERSGIGAKDVLEKAGVKQLVDLPGVGSDYQDHLVLFTPFKATPESSTIDGIVRNEEPHFEQWSKQWQKDGSGLMATNSIDVAIRLRPTEEEVKAIGPAFQQRWRTYYAPSPDKPIILHTALNALIGDPAGDNGKFFSMGFFTTHPTGRGWIHIRDGQNPAVQPEFVSGFLSTPEDAAVYKWAYKRTREIARRMACFRGEHPSGHPPFAENSKVKPRPATGPVPINAPDLEYSEEDEKVLDEWLKAAVGTTWHSLGTCAMKPRQQGGVVDSNLNVYGVDGLKVCDLSVAPGNVAANTYSTALLIAEKGAAVIAEELGLTNFH